MSKDWIPLGAHLHSPRFGYEHHGIYVGLDRVIYHAGFSEAFKKGSIEDTSRKEFCAGNGYSIRRYEAPHYSQPRIVQRARQRLKDGNVKYHLIFSNCERFATWCVTGCATSEQVQDSASKALAAGGAHYAARQAMQKPAEAVVKHALSRAVAGGFVGAKTGTFAGGATVGIATAAGLSAAPIVLPVVAACAVVGGIIGWLWED